VRHPGFFLVVLGLLVVAAVPLWAVLTAAFGVIMPWLFVGLVFWWLVGSNRRSRHQRFARRRWQSYPLSPVRASPVPLSPPQATVSNNFELPVDVRVKVEQIRRKVDVLLSYASRFPPFSKDLFSVRQTASDYLPRTIDAYLALPPGSADRILPSSGLTALEELRQQLNLLDTKLDDIADDLQRHDFDRLLANRRFLEERFGTRSA
jgi:hypothetical protein